MVCIFYKQLHLLGLLRRRLLFMYKQQGGRAGLIPAVTHRGWITPAARTHFHLSFSSTPCWNCPDMPFWNSKPHILKTHPLISICHGENFHLPPPAPSLIIVIHLSLASWNVYLLEDVFIDRPILCHLVSVSSTRDFCQLLRLLLSLLLLFILVNISTATGAVYDPLEKQKEKKSI